MRPCTSTNIHQDCQGHSYFYTIEQSMEACRNAGFNCIDINLHSAAKNKGPLSDDKSWERWVDGIIETREKNGLETPYAHSYFYVYPDRNAYEEKLTRRSILAAGMLGVKWVVVHPYSVCDDAWYSHSKSIEDNKRYLSEYAEILSKFNTSIAVENMVEEASKRRYSSSAEDLLELYEILSDDKFGICWDFGHGERSNCNTNASLRMIGDKLKTVHVHDYTLNKIGFDHTIPYLGKTDWNSIMPVMKEIGYTGDWNFECQNFTNNLPPELRETALKLAYETNVKMVSLGE